MLPTKPPRGKYGKETQTGCGLLVTVIKTLDASETNEERQKEKLKIEKEFKKSDQKLNDLVARNDGELTQVMQLFGQISAQVTASRDKIQCVKENLQTCKQLLHCRRDELKKLWLDAVQQKYIQEMLEQINELRKVPLQVQSYTTKKHYLHATKILTVAIALGNGTLCEVEGLNELRKDLDVRKEQLYGKLLEELTRHIYHMSTMDSITNFQRHGSTRNSNYQAIPGTSVPPSSASPFQRNIIRRSAERAEANTKIRKALFEMAQGFDIEKTEIIVDTDLLDRELNSTYFIGIIIECFALLEKVPESLETIKVQIQSELQVIVTKCTSHIFIMKGHQSEMDQPLINLIDLIYKQFKLIANVHTLLLKNYLSVTQRHGIVTKLYDLNDYWIEAQAVLQSFLMDYLDVQNPAADEAASPNFIDQSNNINNYFSRRKMQSKKTLFKFDKSSSHTSPQQLQSTSKEHRRNASDISNDELLLTVLGSGRKKRDKQLVCQCDPSLIRKIYLPLMNYVTEMEGFMKCKPGQQSNLNIFLTQFVRETFLARGHNRNLQLTIESLSKNQDAWRAIITPEQMKSMGLTRTLLQSTVLVEQKICETKNLMQDLPNYSEDLLKMVCSLLKTYRETCQAAYRGIVQPETEEKRIYSVAWLKDDDISRFLKTLPNWTDLKSSTQRTKVTGRKSLKTNMYMTSEEESPTQVQQRNIREAEMLTSNLGEGRISQQEILSDISILKELAVLQESMEWFSGRISEFANDLRKPILNGLINSNNDLTSSVSIKDGTIKVLTNLALEFDDLANTCLLVLHLEVRVQCFHYLKTNPSNKSTVNNPNKADSLEPDAKVLKLTKVLSEMDEALNSTLHPRKTKYIFEGLAHLASRILIMSSNYMESIDQAGVQRMCRNALALQQTLSSITASREIALDHAKNFYEMLYMDPDEILTTIIEKGPQFTEMQYLNALQLSCKGNGMVDFNSLSNYQQKLSDILGTKPAVGVTV